MKILDKNEVNQLKQRLKYYNFSLTDDNDSYHNINYVDYVLSLRHDSEYIDTFINNITNSKTSKKDIPLILDYMDYLERLIKVCQMVIQDINRTRWSYKEMTKKYAINLVVEQETRLFDNYTSLVSELSSIINNPDNVKF